MECPEWKRTGVCSSKDSLFHNEYFTHTPRTTTLPPCPFLEMLGSCDRMNSVVHSSIYHHPAPPSQQDSTKDDSQEWETDSFDCSHDSSASPSSQETSTEDEPDADITCPVFEVSGICRSPACKFHHPSIEEWNRKRATRPLCKMWTLGQCWGCLDRHYYDETDQRLQATPRADGHVRAETGYSSPYMGYKIVQEVERIRREEIDLETGRKKSFTEVREYEVVDLTQQRTPLTPIGNTRGGNEVFKFPPAIRSEIGQGVENSKVECLNTIGWCI